MTYHPEDFVDGVTEELITQLAAMAPRRLGVIARTTAMRYRHTRKDVARIGRVQKALDGLERACEEREPRVLWLRVAPTYDALRADPRYHLLLRRIALPPVASSLPTTS